MYKLLINHKRKKNKFCFTYIFENKFHYYNLRIKLTRYRIFGTVSS